MKQIKTSLILITFSVIIFLTDLISQGIFGKFVNLFFPCVENEEYSAPCSLNYDMVLFFILLGIITLSLLSIVIIYIIHIGNKKKIV